MADENLNVAAELARLRGDMTTGLTRIEGRLDLIAQSQGRDREELEALDARVSALEERRIPLAVLASVSGAVSAVVAAVALLVQ